MAAKEYKKCNELSTAMLLVCIFQFIYVADCLLYEVSEDEDLLSSTYSMLGFKNEKERGQKGKSFFSMHATNVWNGTEFSPLCPTHFP